MLRGQVGWTLHSGKQIMCSTLPECNSDVPDEISG